ncbi:MAG: hypothetical protein HY821_03175 [Acidobacteria bacterium]|nr:hypothetical protein [Acidobacteriota bacterium]
MNRLFLIAALLAAGPGAFAQVGLGMTPMRLELPLQPGQASSGALDLSTDSPNPVRVRAELLDFYVDDSTTPQFVRNRPEEAAHSCRTWLAANPMEAELPAASHQLVRYSLRVPPNTAPGSYYCAIGYTALPSAEQLKQTGIRTTVRVVAVFYALVGQPRVEGEITGLALEPVPGAPGRWFAVLSIRNRGEWHFRPQGQIRIQGENGNLLETLQVPSFPVLPRRDQRFVIALEKAQRGEIRSLKAGVDLGAHEAQEAVVDVPPAVPSR